LYPGAQPEENEDEIPDEPNVGQIFRANKKFYSVSSVSVSTIQIQQLDAKELSPFCPVLLAKPMQKEYEKIELKDLSQVEWISYLTSDKYNHAKWLFPSGKI